jgi:hypothetical protein
MHYHALLLNVGSGWLNSGPHAWQSRFPVELHLRSSTESSIPLYKWLILRRGAHVLVHIWRSTRTFSPGCAALHSLTVLIWPTTGHLAGQCLLFSYFGNVSTDNLKMGQLSLKCDNGPQEWSSYQRWLHTSATITEKTENLQHVSFCWRI